MTAPHRCNGCTTRWHGAKMAHCSACHHTFSVVRYFDAHRVGGDNNRQCLDPRTHPQKFSEVRPGVFGGVAVDSPSVRYRRDGTRSP